MAHQYIKSAILFVENRMNALFNRTNKRAVKALIELDQNSVNI